MTESSANGSGFVYLLHFDRRYKHAGHQQFAVSSRSLKRRLAARRRGDGARLLEVVHEAGIGWQLARTWSGGRGRERPIKRQAGASRCCPLCGITPRVTFADLPRNADGSLSRSCTADGHKAAARVMTSAQRTAHTALRPRPKDDRAGKARARAVDPSLWLSPLSQGQP
jgi:hypothetical protein